jgi:phosphoglycerate kinase
MKKTLSEVDAAWLAGRTAVVRSDLNVPLDGARIVDDQRIRASLPTLELLTRAGARVVLLSHLGRPKGKPRPDLTLAPVAAHLAGLLDAPVEFAPDATGADVARRLEALPPGGVLLLENTRFLEGETSNDAELAASWAALGDIFVNDAFGAAHRAHASTTGLAEAMIARGGEAVAGLLMARELRFLEQALRDPERPFVTLLGGAKISGKIDLISAMLPRVDRLLVGGAMANTFFRAMGLDTGGSLVEEDKVDEAAALLQRAGDRLVLPVDCVVAPEVTEGAESSTAAREDVRGRDRIVDIGPTTRELFADILSEARTIVWNGPMGVFEIDAFAAGTLAVAEAVARACDGGALGVVGGGDSAAAAERAGVADRLTHVSTGGGASLELLAGATLPGVASLSDPTSSQE